MATGIKLETGATFLTPVTEADFLTPEKFDDEQRLMQEAAATFVAARSAAPFRSHRAPRAGR